MDFLLQNFAIFLGLIILAYFSWRKIKYGIYAIIFSLPAYLLRFKILGVPTTFLEIGIYLLFIFWFLQNFPRRSWLENIGKWMDKNKLLVGGIFLLMTGAAISTALSDDLRTSAGILKGWFMSPLLFFLVLTSAISSSGQIINVAKSFFLSGLAVSAISLFYWFGILPGGVSYDGRLHAFYASPNYLAMYLAPVLITGVFLLFRSATNRAEKIFSLTALFVIFTAFYLTYSYAAWAALAFSFFLPLHLFLKKLPLARKFLLLAACGLILIAVVFSQVNTDKFRNLKNLSYRSSLNSRIMIWRAAWLIAKDHPLLGIGPGNFQKYYLDYQPRVLGAEPYLEWAVPQPHNIFLAFWLETGILGLAGFILLIAWFLRTILNNFCKNRPLSILLFSLMAYLLVHGLVDTTYWKNDLSVIFWIIIGLAYILSDKDLFPKSSTGY